MADAKAPRARDPQGAPGLPENGEADIYDVAVVGGGPAGLQAALKAALLYKTCVLLDKGRKHSRIFFTPKVDNIPGHPEGVHGSTIIEEGYRHIAAQEEQLGRRFVDVRTGVEVKEAGREEHPGEEHPLFVLRYGPVKTGEEGVVRARNFILATGVVDRQPRTQEYRERDIDTILPYANRGLADYCLLCDGHAVENKRVAVIGCSAPAATVAASLKKNFRAETVLVTCGGLAKDEPGERMVLPEESKRFLAERGIPILDKEVKDWFGLKERFLGIEFTDGTKERFDHGWISMGWHAVNSELAVRLGARTDDEGAVKTDQNCEALDKDDNVIHGLFAVGDVRADSWNQIPIAWGEAEMAVIHAFASHL